MDLWIRSQDKKRLTKVNDLYIVHDDNNFCDYIGNNMVGHLAKYTKENRALEVLEEINNFKTCIDMIYLSDEKRNDLIVAMIEKNNSFIYSMPKE